MHPQFTVRRARRSDAGPFLDLVVALAKFERLRPPNQAARRRIARDIFDRKKLKLLVAVSRGVMIGYALYFFTYSSFLARPTLYIEDLFVRPHRRVEGVGRSLLLRCARDALLNKCGRMEWSVLEWNKGARSFYEKAGAENLRDWTLYRLDSDSLKRLARTPDA